MLSDKLNRWLIPMFIHLEIWQGDFLIKNGQFLTKHFLICSSYMYIWPLNLTVSLLLLLQIQKKRKKIFAFSETWTHDLLLTTHLRFPWCREQQFAVMYIEGCPRYTPQYELLPTHSTLVRCAAACTSVHFAGIWAGALPTELWRLTSNLSIIRGWLGAVHMLLQSTIDDGA